MRYIIGLIGLESMESRNHRLFTDQRSSAARSGRLSVASGARWRHVHPARGFAPSHMGKKPMPLAPPTVRRCARVNVHRKIKLPLRAPALLRRRFCHVRPRRNRPPTHVRDHLASRRREDHAHREVPALRQCGPPRRRGKGSQEPACDTFRLDGTRTPARHLRFIDCSPIRVSAASPSICSTRRVTRTFPRTPIACSPQSTRR